jgi:formyl-CoA transferase
VRPPLDGVLVADFSRVLAGPIATMNLADLGATVVKVERPGAGDDTRSWGPPWSDHSSSYFDSINRSKRSVTLDLRDEGDRALAHELARRADVFIENFRPGALERHGLGYEQVRAANPRIVYASITGFGRGAGADLMGYDFLVQAVGGLMSVTGDPDGDPTKAGVALVDVLTGKDATIGILAALTAREHSGQGCRVEVELLSSLLSSMVNQAQGYLQTGRAPRRMGNRHPSIAPYETLHCADGLLAVACGNDGQFARLATALGAPELAADERFATNASRVGHREELVGVLEAQLAAADADTWQQRLTAADVPAGRVGDLADGFDLAERLGLEPWSRVDDRAEGWGAGVDPAEGATRKAGSNGAGGVPQVRHPVRYDSGLTTTPSRPPRLGEDDAAVRAWLLEADPAPLPPAATRQTGDQEPTRKASR